MVVLCVHCYENFKMWGYVRRQMKWEWLRLQCFSQASCLQETSEPSCRPFSPISSLDIAHFYTAQMSCLILGGHWLPQRPAMFHVASYFLRASTKTSNNLHEFQKCGLRVVRDELALKVSAGAHHKAHSCRAFDCECTLYVDGDIFSSEQYIRRKDIFQCSD
jgi:hypothetical protein